MPNQGKLLIYVHFNKKNELSRFVIEQLTKITPEFDRIVIVSNSRLSNRSRKKLSVFTNDIIQRSNIGYDFAAWRDGMQFIGFNDLKKYDNITLMNDTCIGPVYPFNEMNEKFANSKVDFWGMITHERMSYGMPRTNAPIPKHIQSFFMVFRNELVSSDIFTKFWDEISDFKDVDDVRINYELQLTEKFVNAGFTYSEFYNTQHYIQTHNIPEKKYNFTIYFPILLLENRCPLIKRKAFESCDFKTMLSIIKYTNHQSTYKITYYLPTLIRIALHNFIKNHLQILKH